MSGTKRQRPAARPRVIRSKTGTRRATVTSKSRGPFARIEDGGAGDAPVPVEEYGPGRLEMIVRLPAALTQRPLDPASRDQAAATFDRLPPVVQNEVGTPERLIALLTAVLFLSALKTDAWRPAVVASVLWAVVALIGGVLYPAGVQSIVVNPNKKAKEAEFIAHNIEATRHALGIDDVATEDISFGTLSASTLESNVAALQDVQYVKPDSLMEWSTSCLASEKQLVRRSPRSSRARRRG